MPTRFSPVAPGRPFMLHGGDYNPEQWLDSPNILSEDIRLMKLANVNVVSVGIFSWSMLEPREGAFDFFWMDRLLDILAKNEIAAVLATPSGAKPNWMASKYPEIRRIDALGQREPQGHRHNHCYTSPMYREKCTILNTRLAERYGKHPALAMWHVSNEYGGTCYCDLCKAAFRSWLQARYGSLEALNDAYWSRFWSHTYSEWDEITHIDESIHGLTLDWHRFTTDQTVDFFRHESAPLRTITPDIPVTVNMMGMYETLNYWKFAPHVDVIAWDSYPEWHQQPDDVLAGAWVGFVQDINRSMKQRPFMLIESTPSVTNWQRVCPPKRPNMHALSSLQAVAHGSDSVMYFQWRKSRGSIEKFHGAVIDHVGHENTRVFREVAALGEQLAKFSKVIGTMPAAKAAIIFDWENRWALNASAGPRNSEKDHDKTCVEHYQPLWQLGVACDAIDMDQPFDRYQLLIAPMLYMLRPGVAKLIGRFVENGGTFVTTYLSGLVNETDLCFLGGFPGGEDSIFRKLMGIWVEETDVLVDARPQNVVAAAGHSFGLTGAYAARHYCDVIHLETAEALATFASDYYAGRPAVTMNRFGKGRAFYIGSRNDERFHSDLLSNLAADLPRALPVAPPAGVSTTLRTDGQTNFVFVLNFNATPQSVDLGGPHVEIVSGRTINRLDLPAYGSVVLSRPV